MSTFCGWFRWWRRRDSDSACHVIIELTTSLTDGDLQSMADLFLSIINHRKVSNMGPHLRKCWPCGNVAEHADNITPHVLCKKCGSQDTRLIREKVKNTLKVDCLRVLPMSEAEVSELYSTDSMDRCDLRDMMKRVCLSHERLRAELQGAEILLRESNVIPSATP